MKDELIFLIIKEMIDKYKIDQDQKILPVIKKYANILNEEGNSTISNELYDLIGINKQNVKIANNNEIKKIEDLNILEYYDFIFDESDYIDPLSEYSNNIITFLKKNQKSMTKTFKMFILGRPGTGKTSYVKYLSKKSSLPIYIVKASKIVSSYLGDTQKNIDFLLKDIQKINSQGIILIDEMDSFLGNRSNTLNDEYKRMIGSFNIMMDSVPIGTSIIAITNYTEYIDEAIIRRFNVQIELNDVDKNNFYKIFMNRIDKNNIQVDFNIIIKIIDYYDKFENIATYSMIENIIDSNIFLGENIYKNLISQLSKKTSKEIDEKFLVSFKLNLSEISKIMEKDRRTVKNHLSKELS